MQPEHFHVRLRANVSSPASDKPVKLTVDPTLECILVTDYILPLRTLVLTHVPNTHELVLVSGRTRLTLRAPTATDPRWRQLTDLLHRLQRSPRGYLIHAPIGHGAFGTVYRAYILQTGAPVALKAVSKSQLRKHRWALAAARREQLILHALPRHPHVVSASHVFETRSALYTAMELVRGRELHAVLAERRAALPPAVVVAVARQLLSAVAHLHAHGVVHRDIKLENVMLSERAAGRPHVHLVDFGLAQTRNRGPGPDGAPTGDGNSATGSGGSGTSGYSGTACGSGGSMGSACSTRSLDVVGTKYTQAPEIVLQATAQRRWSGVWAFLPWVADAAAADTEPAPVQPASDGEAAVDVWAVGIVLFCLLHGRIPWTEEQELRRRELDMRQMVQLARDGERGAYMSVLQDAHEMEAVPAKLQSLLTGLLQPIADKRLTARAALEHRALKQYECAADVTAGKASLRRAARRMVAVLRTVEVLKAGIGSAA